MEYINKDDGLEELTKRVFAIVSIIILIGLLAYLGFSLADKQSQDLYTKIMMYSVIPCIIIATSASVYHPKIRKTSCILIMLFICCMNTTACVKNRFLFLLPIVLTLYLMDNKFTIISTVFYSLLFIVSNCIRTWFYINTEPVHNFIGAAIGTNISFLVELVLILALFIPIYNYINNLNKNILDLSVRGTMNLEQSFKFATVVLTTHNAYLKIHNDGVFFLTGIILKELQGKDPYFTKEKCKCIYQSVIYHDLGKLYLSTQTLDSPNKLTPEEWELMKLHPFFGVKLFHALPIDDLSEEYKNTCDNIILEHHEKLDGSGYPNGLKKDEISLEGQLIAVADMTDAIMSVRSYKKKKSFDETFRILEVENKNKINQRFVKILKSHKEEIEHFYNDNKKTSQNF